MVFLIFRRGNNRVKFAKIRYGNLADGFFLDVNSGDGKEIMDKVIEVLSEYGEMEKQHHHVKKGNGSVGRAIRRQERYNTEPEFRERMKKRWKSWYEKNKKVKTK